MKRLATILILACLSVTAARAQVFILNDNIFQGRMSEIKTTVLDSLTNEPVSFASVYVIPSKDTTITNFTLTDAKGEAKLDDVPYGSYVFHVEMMGYKPYLKERFFREERVDLGTIRLQVDELFLKAATVTDVGNPIVIKQDTVEFNASSFRVGANAMLKDLLKRMPGMEITEDGKVTFNGEAIDKLTVGGRTFFFNDQSTALNNLPASIVDKIRVIDRESEQTRASGIQDGNREKVLDVALKKEYEKGWFGNVGLKAGSTIGEKDGDDVLRDNRGLLYNGNALASAYTEKDQVTFIANGQNINDSNAYVIVLSDAGERSTMNQGLSTAAQLAVNANTSRIKDVETTVSVNYKYSDTDSGSRADRTTYQDDGNLSSSTQNTGKAYANGISANMEFEKETGKVWFHVRPDFRWNKSDYCGRSSSETYREGSFVNSSDNTRQSLSDNKTVYFDADMTFREIGGKEGRTLQFAIYPFYGGYKGGSLESSIMTTAAGKDERTMTYNSNGLSYGMDGSIRYTEPIGEKWTLAANAYYDWSRSNDVRDAFDAAGRNDYYSSESRNNYWEQRYDLTAQYKFGQGSWITFGGRTIGILNETYSKSYGIGETTGKDEWNWFFAPSLRFIYSKGSDRISVNATGYGRQPSTSQMLPVLNIGNPSRLSLGNIYLKPYTMTTFNVNYTRNNREKFSTLMAYLYGQINQNSIGSAMWYDTDGIMYSVPVNASKPSLTASVIVNYTTPLDGKKLWSLTFSSSSAYSSSVSYQAGSALPGLDKDTFDYSAFMADFWGSADGDKFYSGQSGFGESSTQSINPSAGLSVKYNPERWWFSLGANTTAHIARYSLNPLANLNTLTTRISAYGSYTTKHEYEFTSDLDYVFYRGYAEGYGQPEWQWNADISKNIGAFNLSIKLHDILNQTRNLTHTVTANYEEDSYRLVMGRYILFGVKWNFGKMNASHSSRARQAAFNMVF
ncbi:MAG: outer membrane beta-barrel protein [Bacteroidales bacterium]|nr:outer membrane beta-barrel protein [Bacteroidales bacterium]MBO4585180.1 outer membrane beta-barrel protein [Bacteroidales bacterium]